MKTKALMLGAAAALACSSAAALAERASDGDVKIIYWQAPSILNPFLSGGTKDVQASSLVIEPLARYDKTGQMVPWLVEEIPTVENGGVAEDLTSITWTLRDDITWSDGTPFTSADVQFTAEYCMNPDMGCAQVTKFEGVESVETPDAQTVVVNFDSPTPVPYLPFVGAESPIIQKAQFAD